MDNDGWRSVRYSFIPGDGRPTDVVLRFTRHFGVTMQAKLPGNHDDVLHVIDRKIPFVLSNQRINMINEECLEKQKVRWLEVAITY